MKVKTSELTGAALDWAVSTCQNLDYWQPEYGPSEPDYSTDWAQGGPIIERERIAIQFGPLWAAIHHKHLGHPSYGPTPLIAAMRCYVSSKLGNEAEIPDELIKEN